VCADEAVPPQVDNDAGQESLGNKVDSIVSDRLVAASEKENEKARFLTDNTVLLPGGTVTTKPSVSKLSNWPVVLLMLLGIVCLIFALAWFVKRFGGFNMGGGRDMRVLSSVALGARERVALIDVKGQQFLIGVTTQNINHLHTFDEAVIDTTRNDVGKLSANRFPKSDFSEKLQQILKKA
jgi:flagellar biosynthetic protein FliO